MDGTGAAATFIRPLGVTSDGNSLYVTDAGASTVRRIDMATSAVTNEIRGMLTVSALSVVTLRCEVS